MTRLWLLLLVCMVAYAMAVPINANSCTADFAGGPRLPYPMCNESLPLQERVADLLSRMTYQEKCAALDTGNPAISRLGLPSLTSGEGLHGVVSGCGAASSANSTGCPTSFPNPLTLGATFNRELWHSIGHVIGTEARALYNQQKAGIYLFTPNLNPARDPRWGRNQEVPSESAYHAGEYGSRFIQGLQFSNDPRYLQVAATMKHWLVYDIEGYIPRTDPMPRPPSAVCDTPGGCERWNFDGSPPLRDLVAYFTRPFEVAVKEAHVASIMCSYNAAYGKPTCANSELNNGLMRGEWGFDGAFLSDFTAIELMQDKTWDHCQPPYPGKCVPNDFPGGHNYTFTIEETAKAALAEGGIDYNLGAFYRVQLYAALQNGAVSQKDVDIAAGRVYTMHLKLGLLDTLDHQVYPNFGPDNVDTDEHRQLALRAAQEGIVLLKNDKGLLPFSSSKRLALIGPHVTSTVDLLSNYHGDNELVNTHSPLAVAQSRHLSFTYARGCNICDDKPAGYPNMPCEPGHAKDRSGFTAAVAAAKAAEIAILFVGLDQTSEAENFDRDVLTFPGVQEDLIKAVVAVQPNTVVVLINGGVVSSPWMVANVPAIVEAFYPGELGGEAIWDVLLGVVNPAGKMPLTTYYPNITSRDIRDVDLTHDGGITHNWFLGPVLYPFGWGLSYTTFSYTWTQQDLKFSISELQSLYQSHGSLDIEVGVSEVTVKNTGTVTGDCVVLAFVTAVPGQSAPGTPIKDLFGFERLLALKPGESRSALFGITLRSLTTVSVDGRRVLAPSIVEVQIGDVVQPATYRLEISGGLPVVLEENTWARKLLSK